MVGFASLAHADFGDGHVVYDRGDYAKAYEEFEVAAELGECFRTVFTWRNVRPRERRITGVCTDQPDDAVQGGRVYAEAQVELGIFYLMGKAGSKNYVEAAGWFRKAAEQGDAGGQFMLGLRYEYGEGVPQDYD